MQYNPSVLNVKQILMDKWPIYKHNLCSEIGRKEPLLISSKKDRSLEDKSTQS